MRKFLNIIKDYQNKQNIIISLKYLCYILITVILVFHIFFVVYNGVNGHRGELFLFGISLKIFMALISIYYVLQGNRKFVTKNQSAKALDQFNNDKTDTYQNALELLDDPGSYNTDILDIIYAKADKCAENQEIKPDKSGLKTLLFSLITLAVLSGLLGVFQTERVSNALDFFSLRHLPEQQHKTFVELLPGNLDIVRNSDVEINIINPEPEVKHTLFYKRDKIWREVAPDNYQYVFRSLDYSLDYFVKTDYATSDTFRINIFDIPAVKRIDVSYDYPDYTAMKGEYLKDVNGNIKAIIGTNVGITIEANNPLESAEAIFFDGSLQSLERIGKKAFRLSFPLEKSGSYHFNLIDILGNSSRPIEKSITAIPDKEPEIIITYPGKDTILTQNMLLPLKLAASDDFGLKNLNIFYHVNDGEIIELNLKYEISETVMEMDYTLNLEDLFLIPGDRVTYWAEISDNAPEKHTSKSQKYVVRFPSIEEIYEEIEEQEKEKSEKLTDILEKSEDINKEYEEKRRELLRKDEYDWEDKKSLEEILNKQENLSQDVQKVAEEYQKLTEKFQNNDALAQETMEKMQKIQELMEDISNEEMMKAMEKLRNNMEQMDPEVMRKAMEDFKFSLEDFSQKLQQTIDMLEAIKKEQALQKALEISEEMTEMQESLKQKTEDSQSDNSDLAAEQERIQDKLQSLKEQLDTMQDMLDPQKDKELMDALEELKKQMQQDNLGNDLQESMEQLQQNNKAQAQESQQQAMQKMQKMNNSLNNMMQMMASSSMADMSDIIQSTIKRLLLISYKQEESAAKYEDDPFVILPDQIAVYESVNMTLQKLYSVPMIMFALGPKFVYDANFTNQSYREMFQYINDAKKYKVPEYLKDALKGINLMIYDLMQSSNNMQQGGGGGGMQSLMQALQQMGQQQMAMNMITQQLMQQLGNNGKLTNDMRDQAQRLAQEESRLAENLKRMLQSNQEAQKQTASLNRIIDDLEAISHDLKRGRINQDLVDKQERILSRLLDAQKSVHKREFSKKRKAETSEIQEWDLPEEIKLKFDKMRQKALLDEDYKDFPKEYQELIKEYLKQLNERADQLGQ